MVDVLHLRRAAEDSRNEALQVQIGDQDCVAIEVRYHFGVENIKRKFKNICSIMASSRTGSDLQGSWAKCPAG